MKKTMTAALIAALATPAVAGGPVIVEEGAPAVEESTNKGSLLVPLLVLVAVGLLVGSNDSGKPDCPSTQSCA